MTIPTTRAELSALREEAESKPIFSLTFWADLGERVITSAAAGALAVVTLDGFDLIAGDAWQAIGIGAGVAALTSVLKGIAAARSGSASLVPGV